MLIRKPKRTAKSFWNPEKSPPQMVLPLRDTPGKRAMSCHSPTLSPSEYGASASVFFPPAWREATHSIPAVKHRAIPIKRVEVKAALT